ncbi:MBL fold metallo-hydrolase [Hydrogenophaga crassostreae]|uniref:MBL fold metallo-hydrolase n=1 Tax=Hydrogenophaga crassostreae TaxID=1763535 RepID=A0A167HNF7_9BURK|nr:MBL fold metallo-hydrolase [Hydrogenophaga crassostreae]AOW14927.1 MBL fold metallo-hydrolase [Hydrogenophaga crassostreae]OAD41494.1 MBL fold metallo-hydrolase [Hydrogenophaga crassostreae]
MVRTTQLLHPQRTPAALRPAATVLLLRDSPQGIEVLMTRRSMTASFAPGAYVFPGGGIDAADALAHGQSTRRAAQSDLHLTQAIAAIRESFEELGVLLARRADGSHLATEDIAALDRRAPFAAQCSERGLTLSGAEVFVLAHWITDRDLPRRFDVPFLVARMPEGQEPVADESEQFEPEWVRPADALSRHEAGNFFIIFPTIRTLDRLKAHGSVQSVLDACAVNDEPLFTSCPRAGFLNGAESRHMEHEAPFGELAMVSPDGQIKHELAWQTERPVPLLRNVMRLTAPNPGFMTGPGTNSYLVGDPSTGYIAIDPGPAEPAHLERLWRAAGGDLRAIVCTHSHADHSPGAPGLQALCTKAPPILGLASAPTARANSHFIPERELGDDERLTLKNANGDTRHTLRVVHTPGHAANHLCLVLEEDGLLISGDHVLNGSTTVIDPPDGHMGDYLASLDKLAALCDEHAIDFILPAHGYVLGDLRQAADNLSAPTEGGAKAAIEHLKAHRLAREAKVARAMQASPKGTMDDWVKLAYDDVPERLWPVAKRSMLAHVERIQSLGGFNL